MNTGHVRVSAVTRGLGCVIKVSGELSQVTEREFAVQVAEALATSRGPLLFDVSDVDFVDLRGARALARALRTVQQPREAGLDGCSLTMLSVLGAIGFDLPHKPELTRARLRLTARQGTSAR